MFDIAAQNAEEVLTKDRLINVEGKNEDLEFLKDQRPNRLMDMDKLDTVHQKAVLNKLKRDQKLQDQMREYERSANEKQTCSSMSNIAENEVDMNLEQSESNDPDFLIPKKKPKVSTVTVEVPKNIFKSPDIISTLDRHKVTDRAAVGITASLLRRHY